MKVKATVILLMLLVVSLATFTADAGAHFIGGVSFSIGSLIAQGDLAGFGQQNVAVTLTGNGTVKAICTNQGGNQAPGRNPIAVTVSQTNIFSTDQNGKATITVETPDPSIVPFAPSPTAKQAGCPNTNWVVSIAPRSTNWTSALLVVKSSDGAVLFQQSYACVTTFNSDGTNSGVTCTPQ